MIARFTARQALAGTALLLAAAFTASAQPAGQAQPSGAMSAFSPNRDQPVRIESNTLEVRDKIRQAVFAGDVKLTQGDTVLKCKVLVVFYEDPPPPAASKKGAPPGQQPPQAQKSGGQQIKRAEAKGDVLITQKDQTASGDNGVYDLKANTVVMTGNVVVTQGQAVTRGERMVVNLETGITKVERGSGGRVEFLTVPGAKDAKTATPVPPPPAPAPPPPPAPPASAKVAPKTPTATK